MSCQGCPDQNWPVLGPTGPALNPIMKLQNQMEPEPLEISDKLGLSGPYSPASMYYEFIEPCSRTKDFSLQ